MLKFENITGVSLSGFKGAHWSEAVPQNTFAMSLVSHLRITWGILAGKIVNSVKFIYSRLLHFPLHIKTDQVNFSIQS